MNRSLPKLLITGARGFTGRHACRHFVKAGYEVIAVTRKHIKDRNVQIEICDLTDKDAVRNLVKKTKPQYILHLAGQSHVVQSWNNPVSTIEANFLATLYLIEAVRAEIPECKIVVVGSALQFDPGDISTLTHPYSFSKTLQALVAEAWADLYKLNIVIAKPSNLIGPGVSQGVCSIFAQRIVSMEKNSSEEKILEINNLGAQRDFIDVRDAVTAYEVLFSKGQTGETYEISSGRSYSLEEVVNCLHRLTSVDFQVKTKMKNVYEEEFKIHSSKIMNLGWLPTISMQTSLEDILNYYRKDKGAGMK